ncbi:1, 4-beta cellobiohydrolase [Naviculisporaceae sp. PSN 640]
MAARLFLTAALAASALAAPVVEERQNCASQWGQCGGIGFNGPTCCQSGSSCVEQNPYYSQCLPGAQAPGTTTARTTTTTTTQQTTSRATTSSRTSTAAGPTITVPTTTTPPPVGATKTASFSGNPFSGVDMWANTYYSSEVHTLAIPSLAPSLAAKAAAVAKVPSFQWLDREVTIDTLMQGTLDDIRKANAAGGNYAGLFVVYDLPDRDCAAAASNGEFAIANGGVANYKRYIDKIRTKLITYSDLRIILVIEPDSLANMVTNMNVPKCQGAASTYKELTIYALKQLNLPNVAMYLDAGHAGWLGWPANIQPAADLFAQLYKDAGKPSQVRGLATNVANYNGWNLTSAPSYTTPNPNYDEIHYVRAFSPLLNAAGFPAHFITDTGRSGKQPTGQLEWGHDTTAARYDHHCGMADSLKPAPEAGQWFQAYFEQLLVNANPAF